MYCILFTDEPSWTKTDRISVSSTSKYKRCDTMLISILVFSLEMQWQPMQVPAGVPQQQVILQQQPLAAMTPYQQQVYWQQYYPQWTAVPAMQISQTAVQTQQPKLIQPPLPENSMAKPPLPPDSSGVGINPAPPVEPPKEEKPPLPPEPPPPEPTPPALPTVIALELSFLLRFPCS